MRYKIAVLFPFFLAACSIPNANRRRVTGTYVLHAQSAYSMAMDTIEISWLNEGANTYRYERRVAYRRLLKGQPGPYEHKVERSICVYDKNTARLNEQKHGRSYFFSGDGSLVTGGSVYRRIQ